MSDINLIEFLYLNPELPAYQGIVTVEQARDYVNSGVPAGMLSNLNNLPPDFDAEAFLSHNNEFQDISYLSYTIRTAMQNANIRLRDIESKSKFISTIYKNVVYVGFDMNGYDQFEAADSNFTFSESNIGYGDQVLVLDYFNERYFGEIYDYSSTTISLGPNDYTFYETSNYRLWGIKVCDPERVARINYLRNYDYIIGNLNKIVDAPMPEFNATLYRTLYPDAVALKDLDAYYDYLAKRKNNIHRIMSADEFIVNSFSNYASINNIRILSNIEVQGFSRFFDEVLLTDDVTNTAELVNVKKVTMCNDLRVMGNTYFHSNMTVASNMTLCNNLYVHKDTDISGALVVASNITGSNNLILHRDAYIGSNTYIGSNLTVSNDTFVLKNQYNEGLLFVDSNIMGSNNMIIQRDGSIGSNLFIGSNVTISNDLMVYKD